MSMIRIVYFAWVREKIGIDGEEMIAGRHWQIALCRRSDDDGNGCRAE
jgi:molybdopterin converting factor small subunit